MALTLKVKLVFLDAALLSEEKSHGRLLSLLGSLFPDLSANFPKFLAA
jgi:hypothetical protein